MQVSGDDESPMKSYFRFCPCDKASKWRKRNNNTAWSMFEKCAVLNVMINGKNMTMTFRSSHDLWCFISYISRRGSPRIWLRREKDAEGEEKGSEIHSAGCWAMTSSDPTVGRDKLLTDIQCHHKKARDNDERLFSCDYLQSHLK